MIDFKKICEPYKKEAYETLLKDCSINSIYDATTITDEHPYGEGVAKCFELIRKLALRDGFKVDMCDGHCIELECGEGDQLIGIFAHQDVVPVDGEWTHPPFEPFFNEEENRLYARGTSDDKGPGIAAYYALKALKDNGLIKNFRVRLVFGGDEERGSSCLTYYFETLKKEDPTYGFTPDADFPLIYGEKGIINYKHVSEIKLPHIVSIKAGTVNNIVIDKAEVEVDDPETLDVYLKDQKTIDFKKKDCKTFIFFGKAAHGSTPELGFNSGVLMLKVLGEAYENETLKSLAKLYSDYNGAAMNLKFESIDMGLTTYNVGVINYGDDKFEMIVNFRFPETVDGEKVVAEINKISPVKVEILSKAPYLYYDPVKTPFIKLLYEVYVEETGDHEHKPMAIGGGTYAKEAKNTVAFGSCFPGKVDHIHEVDEKIDLEDFYNSIPIYAHAIYALGNLKNEN